MHLSRRRFLALSATVTLAACSGSDDPDVESRDSEPPDDSSATSTSTSTTSTTEAAATTTSTTTTEAAPTTTVDGAVTELPDDPFGFGVGSGDPDERSVVIWTRLDGELPDVGVAVDWSFTGDDGTELSGTSITDPSLGGSVHQLIEIAGPGSYAFSVGDWTSPTGRTAPVNPQASEVRLATASCQNYESGHYAAHRDIAEWQPDLVLFLGDFIYEGNAADPSTALRVHEGPEVETLDGYRGRYATYLRDAHLQASRGAAPWLTIWDDHEVENNYAALLSENDDDPAAFSGRRDVAYRAWWENTPTRLDPPTPGEAYVIHRSVDVGSLLAISALDGRQYRDPQVSRTTLDTGPPAPGWDDPSRSMLGTEQETWLNDRFASSTATWNCLAQQTVLGDTRLGDNQAILNYDQWDGYHPARERLLGAAPPNFVTVTGDIHLAGVGVLSTNGTPVGVEFVTTSISSGSNVQPELEEVVRSLPAIVDVDLAYRGYTRHTVRAESWTAEYRQVVEITDPDSAVQTWKTFRADAGTPALTEV